MVVARPSLRKLIELKCRDCIYDPMDVGTWREQVAACTSANCPLHAQRPVPRHCRRNGEIIPEAIRNLREKLAHLSRTRDAALGC